MTHETSISQSEQGTDVWADAYPRLVEMPVATDVHERAVQVAHMTGSGLQDFIRDVHTIVAPDVEHAPTKDAMHIEGKDGLNRRELMAPDERAACMEHAATLIRTLGERRVQAADDAMFLKRAGHVAALAVVLTHTYPDGNGRTARTVGQLLRSGLDPQDPESVDDMRVLSKNRPVHGWKVNSYVPTHDGVHMKPAEIMEAAASLDIPFADEQAYVDRTHSVFTKPID